MHKKISFHPKFAAGIDLVLGLFFFFWLRGVGAWWVVGLWFVLRLATWIFLIRLVYYPNNEGRTSHFFSLAFFCLGLLSLMLFAEADYLWYLLAIIFSLAPALSFFLLPSATSPLSFAFKPYRRARLILTMFGLYGIWTSMVAIYTLQIFAVSYWWWLILGAVLSALAAKWWWREYECLTGAQQNWWWLVFFLLEIEFAWLVRLWPLGYFVSGVVLIWFWFVFWLMARFHLSTAGINWKKQKIFLILNAIFLASFLIFIVRWK